MLDEPEFTRWRATAVDALDNARAQARRAAHHWACFLCEQAGQFALKALLHGVGVAAWGHDVIDLAERAAAATGTSLTDDLSAALVRLGRHYIATRYPDAHPAGTPADHFTAADATQATADAEQVLGWVESRWERLLAADAEEDGAGR